jgi:hypothetical protein
LIKERNILVFSIALAEVMHKLIFAKAAIHQQLPLMIKGFIKSDYIANSRRILQG